MKRPSYGELYAAMMEMGGKVEKLMADLETYLSPHPSDETRAAALERIRREVAGYRVAKKEIIEQLDREEEEEGNKAQHWQ